MEIQSTLVAQGAKAGIDSAKLRKACGDFEALFNHMLLKNGRNSMPQGGILGNSNESKIFTSLMDQTLAEQSVKGDGLGIGAMLYAQLAPKPEQIGGNLETTL